MNNTYKDLSKFSLDKSRRLIFAKTRNGSSVFIVIYDENNLISGPNLPEIPLIIEKLENDLSFDFVDALNLDGGSHSLFYGTNSQLQEISKTGGFFCIRE
jgi:hypothetical protein